MNKTKISACIITYNHEGFIRVCLEGAINQEVDFEYEIVIGEDNSSDRTRQICIEYAQKYPNLIKFYPREKNLGMIGNWIETIQNCTGKYIALCEGDDYWTDPLKLQKQVDFLEANPDYVLCFHQVNILKTNGEIVEDFITNVPENYETIETLARLGNYIHTPSVVFRNVVKEFPFEFEHSPIGDFFLYMMIAEHGKLKYLEGKMAVYRAGVGIWSAKSEYLRNLNTAYTHALIVSCNHFDNSVSSLLLDRISLFLKVFENQIITENLLLLNTCAKVNECIYKYFLYENEGTLSETIQMKTSNELIKEVLSRIKKRLWNK